MLTKTTRFCLHRSSLYLILYNDNCV